MERKRAVASYSYYNDRRIPILPGIPTIEMSTMDLSWARCFFVRRPYYGQNFNSLPHPIIRFTVSLPVPSLQLHA